MMKYTLLAGALTIASPALAQTTPQTAPAPATPVATQAGPATTSPTTAAPAAQPGAPTAGTPATTTAQAAPAAQPADATSQVASIVDTEFATYDKDKNGSLSKTEFAAWMDKLKSAAPANATAQKDATSTAKWNDAAFAQADADKSKAVSKEELTGFLSQSAASAG